MFLLGFIVAVGLVLVSVVVAVVDVVLVVAVVVVIVLLAAVVCYGLWLLLVIFVAGAVALFPGQGFVGR